MVLDKARIPILQMLSFSCYKLTAVFFSRKLPFMAIKSSLIWKVMLSCSHLLTNANGVLLFEYLGSPKIHMLKPYPHM